MKPDLLDDLRPALEGACLVGVGNPDLGDDGFGPRLAEALRAAGLAGAVSAGIEPERLVETLSGGGFRNVLFLDAVEFPGPPGAAVLLDAAAVKSRFPQISTHKISLGTLARLIEGRCGARVWLLGVKPLSLAPGRGLSETVGTTLEILRDLILDVLAGAPRGAGGREKVCIA